MSESDTVISFLMMHFLRKSFDKTTFMSNHHQFSNDVRGQFISYQLLGSYGSLLYPGTTLHSSLTNKMYIIFTQPFTTSKYLFIFPPSVQHLKYIFIWRVTWHLTVFLLVQYYCIYFFSSHTHPPQFLPPPDISFPLPVLMPPLHPVPQVPHQSQSLQHTVLGKKFVKIGRREEEERE